MKENKMSNGVATQTKLAKHEAHARSENEGKQNVTASNKTELEFKFKMRVSNFAFSRKLFGFQNDAYWQSKFQSKSHTNKVQFVQNIHKHNIKFKDLMKLTLNFEQKCNPSLLPQNTHFDLKPDSNHKKVFFHDYKMAILDKFITIQFDSSDNQLMIDKSVNFEYWANHIKLARMLNENESFLELSCIKTEDGQFIAFGFLYLCQYLKYKNSKIISA